MALLKPIFFQLVLLALLHSSFAQECSSGECPVASSSQGLIQKAKTQRLNGTPVLEQTSAITAASAAEVQVQTAQSKTTAQSRKAARVAAHKKAVKAAQDVQRSMQKTREDLKSKGTFKPAQQFCVMQDQLCFDMDLDSVWDERPVTDIIINATNPALGVQLLRQEMDRSVSGLLHPEHEVKFNSSTVQLVITRAGEDVRWLDALPQLPTIVYNRAGPDRTLPKSRPNLQVIVQENVGREDQVMVQHIVTNYDSLSDVTVFLQGWPFGHCPGLLRSVRRSVSALLDNVKFAAMNASAGMKPGLVPMTGTFWQYDVEAGKIGLGTMIAQNHHLSSRDARQFAKEQFTQVCEVTLGRKCPRTLWVAEGAQWAVSRERIQKTPKSVYEAGLALGEGWEDKFRGLVYEAIWPALWGEESWTPTQVSYVGEVGQAVNRSRSSDGHCLSDWGRMTLLFSCSEQAEFCERERMLGQSISETWEEDRKYKQVHESAPKMNASITLALFGADTWMPNFPLGEKASENSTWRFKPHMVAEGGKLRAMRQFNASDAPVMWTIEKPDDDLFEVRHIYRTTQSGKRAYLGCNGHEAQLMPYPVKWYLEKHQDGYVALANVEEETSLASAPPFPVPNVPAALKEAVGKAVARTYLSLPPTDHDGYFHCLPKEATHEWMDATLFIKIADKYEPGI